VCTGVVRCSPGHRFKHAVVLSVLVVHHVECVMEGVGPLDRGGRSGHLEAAIREVDGAGTLKSRWTVSENDTSWIASRLRGSAGAVLRAIAFIEAAALRRSWRRSTGWFHRPPPWEDPLYRRSVYWGGSRWGQTCQTCGTVGP